MYVSMKYILDDANANNYAVMAMNSINMEMARAAIQAAEEEHSPMIINMGQGQMAKHANPDIMVPLIRGLAEKASVPIALNLDHGQSFDIEVDCMKRGFSSVMIDASSLEYEENIKRTATITRLAHPHDICVEAELGHVGQAADGEDSMVDLYTDPLQAKDFVERTGIDALAVAIGTAHGNYPKGFVPKLDFDRLRLLKETLKMPLVLHGGSGSGDENIRRAVAGGINKINVCTDAFSVGKNAMLDKLKEDPECDYMNLCMEAERAIKEFVRGYIRLIGSNNRYIYGESTTVGHE